MRSRGKAYTPRGLAALALVIGVAGGCFAIGIEFEQVAYLCEREEDCTSRNNDCGKWKCVEGVCSLDAVPAGTETEPQTLGDCKRTVCDGKGNIVEQSSEADTISDGNPCTTDKCIDKTPAYEHTAAGTKCGMGDVLQCNGAGACVGCMAPSQCGPEEDCAAWLCTAGACSRILKADGTFVRDSALGNCQADFCNAVGKIESRPYDNDKNDDGNPCTTDECKNGVPLYPSGPDGTACGVGCQVCAGGQCGTCAPPKYQCDTAAQKCIPLLGLPNGTACNADTDCESFKCVDGVCCDTPCAGPCTACTTAKTGKADGTCSPITAGTDPDNECQSPTADVCVAGQCQCYNGIQDGAEDRVDCGGNCAPCPGKWHCDGSPPCDGSQKTYCCFPLCGQCVNEAAECKSLQGTPCTLGQDDAYFPLGTKSADCTECRFATCSCL
jgi:hypothetical protein